MRIWDISPSKLCRNYLLEEHGELHAIWVVITENKKWYSLHPETLRWKGKLKAMYIRHDELMEAMTKRGHDHLNSLDKRNATGKSKQYVFVDIPSRQIQILKEKKCNCHV